MENVSYVLLDTFFFVKPKSGEAGVAGGGVSTAGHSFKNPFVEGYCDDAV